MDQFSIILSIAAIIFKTILLTGRVHCHGRLWEPPSRSSMWRRGYNVSVNINDNELNCGGFQNQWITYGGLCGVCGDPYQQQPRENEAGGKYASGLITRLYRAGDVIDVTVDLTANHGGYFEFRLCAIKGQNRFETQDCFDRNPLLIRDIPGEDFQYRIKDRSMQGHVNLLVKLPPKLTCRHCVLQWRYWTGSRWGCEGEICGKGIGPQEEFYGCSDIAIASPSSYTSYLHLVTLPTEYKSVNYSVLNDDKHTKHSPEGSINVILSEFAEERKGPLPKRIPPTVFQIQSDVPQNINTHKVHKQPQKVLTPNTKTDIAKHVQRITVETILNYYKRKGKIVIDANGKCIATGRFRRNPIIQEWCTRGCPGLSMSCPPKICSCKTNKVHTNTIPFVDLSKYRSDLQHKVPFEMNNMLLNSDAFSTRHGEKPNDEFNGRAYHFSKYPTKRHPVYSEDRAPVPVPIIVQNRRVPFSASNIKVPMPALAEMGQYKRFPIQLNSGSRMHNTLGGGKKRLKVRNSFIRTTGPRSSIRRIMPRFRSGHRLTSNRYVTISPVMNGLSFYSAESIRKAEIPAKSSFRFPEAAQPKKSTGLQQASKVFRNIPHTSSDTKYPPRIQVAPKSIVCSASTIFGHVKSMIDWCQKNCSFGFCPPAVCKCL